jgi:CrcB protein
VAARADLSYPLHTLLINVTGSFVLGALLVVLNDDLTLDPAWRLFLVVGYLGGHTTLSGYTFEALALLSEGAWVRAAGYMLGSNGLGLAEVDLGVVMGRAPSRVVG